MNQPEPRLFLPKPIRPGICLLAVSHLRPCRIQSCGSQRKRPSSFDQVTNTALFQKPLWDIVRVFSLKWAALVWLSVSLMCQVSCWLITSPARLSLATHVHYLVRAVVLTLRWFISSHGGTYALFQNLVGKTIQNCKGIIGMPCCKAGLQQNKGVFVQVFDKGTIELRGERTVSKKQAWVSINTHS